MSVHKLRARQRLRDEERAQIGADLLHRYQEGRSIRQICQETGYSIGRVRGLLVEVGVTFRPRGGYHPPRQAGNSP